MFTSRKDHVIVSARRSLLADRSATSANVCYRQTLCGDNELFQIARRLEPLLSESYSSTLVENIAQPSVPRNCVSFGKVH